MLYSFRTAHTRYAVEAMMNLLIVTRTPVSVFAAPETVEDHGVPRSFVCDDVTFHGHEELGYVACFWHEGEGLSVTSPIDFAKSEIHPNDLEVRSADDLPAWWLARHRVSA